MSDETTEIVDSISATLKERPVDLPTRLSDLTPDEVQDVSLEALWAEVKRVRKVCDDHEARLRRLPRLFALATGLDPELSLDLLEEILNRVAQQEPGKGSPNKGADAIASILKGKAGGEKTGGAALVTVLLYLVARYLGLPVP